MALTGFQEVDAVRTLIVHEELIKLKNTGFEITAAVEELMTRATTQKSSNIQEIKQTLNEDQDNDDEEDDDNDEEKQEEEEDGRYSDVYSDEEEPSGVNDEFLSAPQVKRRKRESEEHSDSSVYDATSDPSVLMVPQLDSFLGSANTTTPSLDTISNLNISDSSENATGIKKRILQGTEHDNPSKKKHKSRGVTL